LPQGIIDPLTARESGGEMSFVQWVKERRRSRRSRRCQEGAAATLQSPKVNRRSRSFDVSAAFSNLRKKRSHGEKRADKDVKVENARGGQGERLLGVPRITLWDEGEDDDDDDDG